MELEQPCTKKTPQQLPLVGWEGLENPQPKPQPLDETRDCQDEESNQPPIHWYGKSNLRYHNLDVSRGADWRWLCRAGQGRTINTVQRKAFGREGNCLLTSLALRASGHSIKYIGKRMGIAPSIVSIWAKQYGTAQSYSVITSDMDRHQIWGRYSEVELDAHGRLEAMHDRAWIKAYTTPLTQMEKYYLNHEESKKRGNQNARRRYHIIKHSPEFKVRSFARRQIWRLVCLARGDCKKQNKSVEYLGCTFQQATQYISAMLPNGWSWQNYGKEWHIDHIIQLSDGDPRDVEHIKRVCHYTNLRPLSAHDNLTRPRGCFVWTSTRKQA